MWKHSLAHFYFIVSLRFVYCCLCNTNKTNDTDVNIEKRQLDIEDYSSTELYFDNFTDVTTVEHNKDKIVETNDTTTEQYEFTTKEKETDNNTESFDNSTESYDNVTENDNADFLDNSAEFNETVADGTETDIELNDYSFTTANETTTERVESKIPIKVKKPISALVKKCRQFKKGNKFDLVRMADVWQVVYYQLPNLLKCFKLHIKLVKKKDQLRYAKVYGNFNDSVHWDKCFIEIKSSEKTPMTSRRHFLQGTQSDRGVMQNIIIDEEHCQNTTYLTLHRESADQWLVIKNLLVMRDCDTGDLVVFSRVPLQPRKDDILDALMLFGVNKPNGTTACVDTNDKQWLKYEDSVISPTDVLP